MTQDKIYSGIDLLNKVIDFTELTPEESNWNLNALTNNPPRYVRLKEIEALLSAFSEFSNQLVADPFVWTINNFLTGEFIKQRKIEEYSETIEFMQKYLISHGKIRGENSEIKIGELAFIFPFLVNYKRQTKKLFDYNSGWLAGGQTVRFMISMTNNITSCLNDKLSDLDHTLELFINPKGFTFTESLLFEKYNYPTDDLEEIELNYI
jgi:hypothetical protein